MTTAVCLSVVAADIEGFHRELRYGCFFFLLILLPPTSTLFPYTTLFRSVGAEFVPEPRRPQAALRLVEGVRIGGVGLDLRSEEHTAERQSRPHVVCRLLPEKIAVLNPLRHEGGLVGIVVEGRGRGVEDGQ